MRASEVIELDYTFRGHKFWHKYSDKQLYALKKLILHISSRDNIDIREGLPKWIESMGATKAFGQNRPNLYGPAF